MLVTHLVQFSASHSRRKNLQPKIIHIFRLAGFQQKVHKILACIRSCERRNMLGLH